MQNLMLTTTGEEIVFRTKMQVKPGRGIWEEKRVYPGPGRKDQDAKVTKIGKIKGKHQRRV